jgi:hypothetical protein
MHPTTYVNKLIFAGGDRMELWNIIDEVKVYEFKNILKGQDGAQITNVV